MTLIERIASFTPPDALYCLSCGRHGCPTAPCPARRSAVHFGHEPPRTEVEKSLELSIERLKNIPRKVRK